MELRGLLRRERWRGGDQPGHVLIQRPVIPLLGAQRVTATAAATQVGCRQRERLARRPGDNIAAPAVIPAASAAHSAPAPSCAAHCASRPLCGTASSPPASSLLAGTHTGTGTGTKAVADAVPHSVPGEVVVGGGELSSHPALSAYAESSGNDDEPWT